MSTPLPDSSPSPNPNSGAKIRNFLIAIASIVLTVALFLGLNGETSVGTLKALAEDATPLEVALANEKPTLMEFYADWCTSCQAMAKDLAELKEQYRDRLNFVMLNVDNNKWLPEMLNYHVDGIPHFVFLDQKGSAIAQSIGEIPRLIMAENLEALIAEKPLPYAQATGQVSAVKVPVTPESSSESDPRRHGSQVQ